MKLAPYPEYRESGSPAAPKIPDQWAVHRCRYLFREMDERSKDGRETHLSMSQKHGLIDSSKIDKWRLKSESYAGGKLCKDGDLVLNRLKAHLGVFAHAKQSGVVSPDYTVLRPITDDNPRYFEVLFKSPPFITEFTKSTKGIVKGFWRLYTDDFYSIRALVPPPEEQEQILRYIDSLTTRANKFIRNKRRFIELLKEQKQNVINQAVTRGLDPKVRLKPSGVEWIGGIPEHWEKIKLRNLLKPISTRNRPDLPLLSVVREKGVIVRDVDDLEENHNFIPDDLSNYKVVLKGQFAMNKMKAWQGSYGVSEFDGIVSPAYFVFDMLGKVQPDFFHLAIRSKAYVPFFTKASDGVRIGQWDLSIPRMKEIPFFIPTSNEQDEIVSFVKEQHSAIDQAIARAEREIELMREYRTRLISDVVTGQVDVRGIAVPEVAEDELLALDEDTSESDDVIDDEGDMDETD